MNDLAAAVWFGFSSGASAHGLITWATRYRLAKPAILWAMWTTMAVTSAVIAGIYIFAP